MQIKTVKAAFFSPTGTTGAVARSIADGIGASKVETHDITASEARKQPLRVAEDELLVIAVPVYMGRVPALLGEWLGALRADNAPVVCVAVYGNRAYENALLELVDIVRERGGIPVAGAAFIGEHSFADAGAPVALGRPDADDALLAEDLGRKVGDKLRSVSSVAELPELQVPGERPYAGRTELWDVDFIEVNDQCGQCGLCAEICPVGAIDPQDSAKIDVKKCITCCACIKQCPQNARSMKPGPVMDARNRLNTQFREPQKPECFL